MLGLAEAAGIVLPTLSLYVASLGGSALFLSMVVAAFSIGRLVSSLFFGIVSDHHSMLVIILASLIITVIGHIFFIIAGSVIGGLYLLLISRVLTGFGTGILSVARAFVSKRTIAIERTRFMAKLGIVQFMGYAFTPILGGITVNAGAMNTYNAGTYCLIILDTLLFFALYFGLRGDKESNGIRKSNHHCHHHHNSKRDRWQQQRLQRLAFISAPNNILVMNIYLTCHR